MEAVLLPVWPDAARALGIGRSKAFELCASGELQSVRIGRRRLVVAEGLREYANRLPRTAAVEQRT